MKLERTDGLNMITAFRLAFEHDPNGKAIVGPAGEWLAVNEAMTRILGEDFNRDRSSGKFQDYFPSFQFEPASSTNGHRWTMECECRHRDGTTLLCSIQATRVHDASGAFYYILHVQDVTRCKQNENSVQQLRQLQDLILDSVREGILGLDINGNVLFWNRAAEYLTGLEEEDFRSRGLRALIHDATNGDGQAVAEHERIAKALRTGRALRAEDVLFRRKDGTGFPAEYVMNPIRDSGRLAGSVFTFSDMTEKLRSNELMIKSEKLSIAGQLAAGVAHEIRNPLTSLKGFLQLMRNQPSKINSYYGIMEDELTRIDSILSELLLLAKPQAKQYRKRDLTDILNQVVLLLNTQAILQDIEIRCVYPDLACVLECDEYQLKQLFINLLKNAIEAMREGGVITIRVKRMDSFLQVQIVDQGVGIPKERIPRLGEPFYTTKEKGTGLGLMVSYKIVEHHNGALDIESEIGRGTTFTITFPLANPA